MRAHWLQHVDYEDLGALAPLLATRADTVTRTRLHAGEPLPAATDVDLLVVLGGPMSVNDEAALPWLAPEKAFIGEMIARGRPVLGLCLGAQLIAASQGATVGPAPEREVGWWPVQAVAGDTRAAAPRFRFPARSTTLHWHGEMFGLPSGAALLARSAGCPHQALQVGPRAIGVQFHPEATPAWVRAVLAHSPDALRPGPYIQQENVLLADLDSRCREAQTLLPGLLDFLIYE